MESQGIINVIKKAVEQGTGDAVRYQYGEVVAVSAYGVSAYLSGDTDYATDYIKIHAGEYVSEGDHILVSTNIDNVSRVDKIFPNSLFSAMVADWNSGRLGITDGSVVDFGTSGYSLASGGDGTMFWSDTLLATISVLETAAGEMVVMSTGETIEG